MVVKRNVINYKESCYKWVSFVASVCMCNQETLRGQSRKQSKQNSRVYKTKYTSSRDNEIGINL